MSVFAFSVLTTVATFILLLIGGVVNPTGSSLACPDWPTCYGTFFPEMTGGILYEHTHRLVASTVGLMTCILAALIWKNHTDKSLRTLGLTAVGLVIFQGVLGGITVLYKLPLMVSTAHLGTSMIFFLLLIYISYQLKGSVLKMPGTYQKPLNSRRFVGIATLAVYVQIVLGAFVRHTGSGRACGTDFLLCLGTWLPTLGPAQLHMFHRFFGVIVLFFITLSILFTLRNLQTYKNVWAKKLALLAPYLTLLQIALGVLTVSSFIGLWQVTAHLGIAALLLGNLFLLYLSLGKTSERTLS